MQLMLSVAAVGIFAVIAYSDVCTRRISNALSLAIAILGLIRIILTHDAVSAAQTPCGRVHYLFRCLSALLARRNRRR